MNYTNSTNTTTTTGPSTHVVGSTTMPAAWSSFIIILGLAICGTNLVAIWLAGFNMARGPVAAPEDFDEFLDIGRPVTPTLPHIGPDAV